MKKQNVLLVFLGFLFIPLLFKSAFAKDYFGVWYIKTYDGKTTTVKLLGWQCLDAGCYKVNLDNPVEFYKADAWKNCVLKYYNDETKLNACLQNYKVSLVTSGEKVVVRMKNVPIGHESTHYAIYFFGKGYVGYAVNYAPYCVSTYKYFACGNPNAYDNPETVTLEKISHAYVIINKLQVVNEQDIRKPLEIKVPVSISNEVCTSVKKTNIVGYYPGEDGTYIDYGINTQLELIITNSEGKRVFTDALQTKIEPDECAVQKEFKWIPTVPGTYHIEVIGQIEDPKVVSSTPGKESTTTYVIDPSKTYCYTRIIDLSAKSENGDAVIKENDKIKTEFKYFSGLFLSDSDIVPLPTKIDLKVISVNTGKLVYEKVFTEDATKDYALYSQILGPYASGNYKIEVKGEPISDLCNGLAINPDVESLNFVVASLKKEYEVTFRIYEKGSGKPLEGVEITLTGPSTYKCTTNEKGTCTIKALEGTYTFEIKKIGYNTVKGTLNVNTDLTKIYYLSKEDQPPVVDFSSIKQPVTVRIVEEYKLDLKKYIYDPDNTFDQLKITAYPDKGVSVSINDGIAIIKSSETGEKKVKFVAEDPAGKIGEGTITFNFVPDNPPEIINATKPGNYSLELGKSMSFEVYAKDKDGDKISFTWYVNDKEVKNEALNTSEGSSTFLFTGSSAGMYTIKVVVSDGYLQTTLNWTVTVWEKPKDRAPIAIILVNGKEVENIQIPVDTVLQFDGSKSYDPDGEKLTYAWDLNGDGKIDSTDVKTEYNYTKEGNYTVTLTVEDPEGLKGVAKVYVTVIKPNTDKTPPETTITVTPTNPNGKNGWYVTNVNISFTCKDDSSGCKATYYCIGNENCNPITEYKGGTIEINNNGINYVKYYSVDNAGNKEGLKEYVIRIDKTSPKIVKIGYPTEEECNQYADIKVDASDDVSGIDKITLFIDGVKFEECSAATCSFKVKITKTINFYVEAQDKAGNMAKSSTMEIKAVCAVYHPPSGGGGGGGTYAMPSTPSENKVNVATVIKIQKVKKVVISEVKMPVVVPSTGYSVKIKGTPNAKVRIFIDGKLYKVVELNSSGYADVNLSGLTPGYHIMKIYDMNGNLLYTKYFVVKGLPPYIKIVGLKNNTIYLKLGEESKIQILFNETGNYRVVITSSEFWLNKTITVSSTNKAEIPLIPLTLGTYKTEWKVYRDGKLIADFEIPVKVEPNRSLVVKKATSKKKKEKENITGKLLQFVAKNLKAVLAIILATITGFAGYKYWDKKKRAKGKGRKDKTKKATSTKKKGKGSKKK